MPPLNSKFMGEKLFKGRKRFGLLLACLSSSGLAQTPQESSISLDAANPSNPIAIQWTSTPNRIYQVLAKAELGHAWEIRNEIPLVSDTNTLNLTFQDQNDQAARFYQVVELDLVWIPAGSFKMGSPITEAERRSNEGPLTTVTIGQGFWMGRYEVTQGQYLDVMGSNTSYFNGIQGTSPNQVDYGTNLRRPVELVHYSNVTNYCGILSEREINAGRLPAGYRYRLPTEAEWEYACRAGTTNAFHYGSALTSGMANFAGYYEYNASVGTVINESGIGLQKTIPVGSYEPNAWGLYDMHGNVSEWCLDFWSSNLPGGSITDPNGPLAGDFRVIRGGAYNYYATGCRSAYRDAFYLPPGRATNLGFRLVLAPDAAPVAQ